MGVQITELLPREEISLNELSGKVIAVDGPLFLYQFLTTIRQRDGTPLMDSKGRVTSHLVGLFSRTSKLMQAGLKLVYVFDGEAPDLKKKERERRKGLKQEAAVKYKIAVEQKDVDEMKKYASRTSRLTGGMIDEAKQLIEAFGLPVVQAVSEGEAQAAHIVSKGDAFAVATQDADSLLFGAKRVVRNLSILGRKKKTGKLGYSTVKPEIIELEDVLNELGIDNDQLIALSMIIGTDYNIGGIKGVGPKNGLKLVKKHKTDFDSLFEEVKWDESFDCPWTEVFYTIKKMKVTDDYKLEWKPADIDKIKQLLVGEYEFSEERIDSSLEKVKKEIDGKQQKGLGDWV